MRTERRVVCFDADGVVLNSDPVACRAAEDIVRLFHPGTHIANREEYKRHFSKEAQVRLVGANDTSILRALHRLIMRSRVGEVHLFYDCLQVLRELNDPPLLITAAYAAGVREALGTHASVFSDIRGREAGPKEQLLSAAADVIALYVTDTVTDIRRCQSIGIPVIAVTWGYDGATELLAAQPDRLVSDERELRNALSDRNLLNLGGHHAA